MTRSLWLRIRHRIIVVAGSLALLMMASGLQLKKPVASLDSTVNHHAIHDTELHRIKERIQRRMLIPKKYLQAPRSESTSSST
jgi:hypothetical protein